MMDDASAGSAAACAAPHTQTSAAPPPARGRYHAVVVGAGMAGLLAAKALARHFAAVTILERDPIPEAPAPRRGVPQGRHAHVLIQGGSLALTHLFADAQESFDLDHFGTVATDAARDLRWFHAGVWKARFASGLRAHWCDRPVLEFHLRKQVTSLPNVRLMPACRAIGLLAAGDGARVTGVQVDGAGELPADLVIDAGGQGSRATRWLGELGYPSPPEQRVGVDVAYATRLYRRPPAGPDDGTVLVVQPDPPKGRRGGLLYPLDDERWMVTLTGRAGDHPPADEPGFLAFARSLPVDDLHRCLAAAAPLSPIVLHRFPANVWRRYERMPRWPDGFVVVGDAVAAFNPVYGQGMTVAALDAITVERALRQGGGGARGFARRLQRRLARERAHAWQLAVGADFRFTDTEGPRPAGSALMSRYMGALLEVSADQPVVAKRFLEVIALCKPPSALFAPAVALRVLRRAVRGR